MSSFTWKTEWGDVPFARVGFSHISTVGEDLGSGHCTVSEIKYASADYGFIRLQNGLIACLSTTFTFYQPTHQSVHVKIGSAGADGTFITFTGRDSDEKRLLSFQSPRRLTSVPELLVKLAQLPPLPDTDATLNTEATIRRFNSGRNINQFAPPPIAQLDVLAAPAAPQSAPPAGTFHGKQHG